MAEFTAPREAEFDHREATVHILRFLDQLLFEIWEDRQWLLPRRFHEEPRALFIVRAQIEGLIVEVRRLDHPPSTIDEYGLRGEALRFKMQVIEIANDKLQIARSRVLERESDGRSPRTWWPFRNAVQRTLAAIDGPLESVTKLLGINEGVVEFKKGVEVLLKIAD